jgi:hypothetical protein
MIYSAEAVKAPSLGKWVSMSCDAPLSDSLMKEYPVLEQCFNRSSATLIVGGMGSGKSSLLLQMLTSFWKRVFCFIYVVAPASSLASIKKRPLCVLPEDKFFDGLSVEVAEDITARLTENAKHGRRSLVIFDDVQSQMKDPDIARLVCGIIANMRHTGTSVIILLQNHRKCEKSIRSVASNILLFSVSKAKLVAIHEEHLSTHKKAWESITRESFSVPRTFLLYHTPSLRLFRNFDTEIVYKDG